MRGDGPNPPAVVYDGEGCSPHTRGWSHPLPALPRRSAVLPAHARMLGRPGGPPRAGDGRSHGVVVLENGRRRRAASAAQFRWKRSWAARTSSPWVSAQAARARIGLKRAVPAVVRV
ncbi:hypothetical protein FNX44_012605 [Streptomyces sp. OF1]|uniref:Uncharacterized protein n=1 Tax=Streptomyces alkaliterrae TaxID=2213162 RepID=A0A5P0YSW2_9ACTN|nr:hypothetical protein [Streptomyces alkaliterrae]